MPEVDIQRACDGVAPDDASFEQWVGATLAFAADADAAVVGTMDLQAAVLSVRIVDAPEGRALNLQWRGRDAPTNVLSFAAGLPVEVGLPLLGDLVLCAPVVVEEARAQGKTEADHWAHLVVHGVLHLLGMDHLEALEAERMEALERRVLATLGIADPYVIREDVPGC